MIKNMEVFVKTTYSKRYWVRFFTVPLKLSFKDKDTRVVAEGIPAKDVQTKLHHPLPPQPQKDRTL
jgi:hypothetical protein